MCASFPEQHLFKLVRGRPLHRWQRLDE